VVAASVSEWMLFHSLTLAATMEMKSVKRNRHRGDSIKGRGALRARIARIRWRFPLGKDKNHHALAKYRHSRANP
jgi:hypothetical protein